SLRLRPLEAVRVQATDSGVGRSAGRRRRALSRRRWSGRSSLRSIAGCGRRCGRAGWLLTGRWMWRGDRSAAAPWAHGTLLSALGNRSFGCLVDGLPDRFVLARAGLLPDPLCALSRLLLLDLRAQVENPRLALLATGLVGSDLPTLLVGLTFRLSLLRADLI